MQLVALRIGFHQVVVVEGPAWIVDVPAAVVLMVELQFVLLSFAKYAGCQLAETGATEIHGSCSRLLPDGLRQTSADEVRAVLAAIAS